MTEESHLITIEELEDLLEAEKESLLVGDLAKVGRLVERKETLIENLGNIEQSDVETLEALNEKLKRNQVLMDSALEGIRRVAQRLSALRRVNTALDTYDAQGDRHTIDLSTLTSVEKRA